MSCDWNFSDIFQTCVACELCHIWLNTRSAAELDAGTVSTLVLDQTACLSQSCQNMMVITVITTVNFSRGCAVQATKVQYQLAHIHESNNNSNHFYPFCNTTGWTENMWILTNICLFGEPLWCSELKFLVLSRNLHKYFNIFPEIFACKIFPHSQPWPC